MTSEKKVVTAQELSAWHGKYNPFSGNIGRGVGEFVSSDYKEVMNSLRLADDTLRGAVLNKDGGAPGDMPFKDAISYIDYSLKKNFFVDTYYYANVAAKNIRRAISEAKQYVDPIRQIGAKQLLNTEVFTDPDSMEEGLKTEAQWFQKMVKHIVGDPMEKAYKKEVMRVKQPLTQLNVRSQYFFADVIKTFNELGSARAKGDVGAWIGLYDALDAKSKAYDKYVSGHHDLIKKLIDAAKPVGKTENISTPEVASRVEKSEAPAAPQIVVEEVAVEEPKQEVAPQAEQTNIPSQESVIPQESKPSEPSPKKEVKDKKVVDNIELVRQEAVAFPEKKQEMVALLDIVFSDFEKYILGRKTADIIYNGEKIGYTSNRQLYFKIAGKFESILFRDVDRLAEVFGVNPKEYLSSSDIEYLDKEVDKKSISETLKEVADKQTDVKVKDAIVGLSKYVSEHKEQIDNVIEESGKYEVLDSTGKVVAVFSESDVLLPTLNVSEPLMLNSVDETLSEDKEDESKEDETLDSPVVDNEEDEPLSEDFDDMSLQKDKEEQNYLDDINKTFADQASEEDDPEVKAFLLRMQQNVEQFSELVKEQINNGETITIQTTSEEPEVTVSKDEIVISPEGEEPVVVPVGETVVDEEEQFQPKQSEDSIFTINESVWNDSDNFKVLPVNENNLSSIVGKTGAKKLIKNYVNSINSADYIIMIYDHNNIEPKYDIDAENAISSYTGKLFSVLKSDNKERIKGSIEEALNLNVPFVIVNWSDGDLFEIKDDRQVNKTKEPIVEDTEYEPTVGLSSLESNEEDEVQISEDLEERQRKAEGLRNPGQSSTFEERSEMDTKGYTSEVNPDVFYDSVKVLDIEEPSVLSSFGFNLKDPADLHFARQLLSSEKVGLESGDAEKVIFLYDESRLSKDKIPAAKKALFETLDLAEAYASSDIYFVRKGDKKSIRSALLKCKDLDFIIIDWFGDDIFEFAKQKQPVTASLQNINNDFYSRLEKVASSGNKYAIASMLLDHSELIEKLSPEMSIKLIRQAENLLK